MDTNTNFIEPLAERVENYSKTTLALYKLKAVEKTAVFTSIFVSKGFVVLVLSMFLIFVSLGFSLFLGDCYGKLYIGFFIVSGIYLLAALVFSVFFSISLKKRIVNLVISELLK
ncbi:MAG: hypothetical protein HYZ42_09125 [Bacteroidetes bacterium]|nr:hypothetical protein [Bacteroidota bacterium]